MPVHQATSLDFISHPNPVEPNAAGHGNVSSGNHLLEKRTNEELLRALLGPRVSQGPRDPDTGRLAGSRPSQPQQPTTGSLASVLNNDDGPPSTSVQHVRKEVEQSYFTLPELPVKRGVKRPRQRVPPVLQGLHQPPPNAGILPSINTEGQSDPTDATRHSHAALDPQAVLREVERPKNVPDTRRVTKASGRRRWTEEETAALFAGVARFGKGKWKKILQCPDLSFDNRTTVDLKDRFRSCAGRKKQPPGCDVANASSSGSGPIMGSALGLGHNSTPLVKNQHRKANRTVTQQSDSSIRHHEVTPSTNACNITYNFPQSTQQQRNPFTAIEDEALLEGFRKYGRSWTLFQVDPRLKQRRARDLRDRFRLRYPDEYGAEGLAPKRKALPSMREHSMDDRRAEPNATVATQQPATPVKEVPASSNKMQTDLDSHQKRLLDGHSFEDNWIMDLQLPDSDDDADADPLVLDRSIMDWADKNLPSLSSTRMLYTSEPNYSSGIDPLVTLKLPKPSNDLFK